MAGRFLVVTNTDMPIEQAVSAYKEQWQIERSFRTIKSFLEVRLIERKLGNKMTISSISAILSGIKAVPLRFPSGTGVFRTESAEADAVLKRLDIPIPKRVLTGTLPEMD